MRSTISYYLHWYKRIVAKYFSKDTIYHNKTQVYNRDDCLCMYAIFNSFGTKDVGTGFPLICLKQGSMILTTIFSPLKKSPPKHYRSRVSLPEPLVGE